MKLAEYNIKTRIWDKLIISEHRRCCSVCGGPFIPLLSYLITSSHVRIHVRGVFYVKMQKHMLKNVTGTHIYLQAFISEKMYICFC